MDKRRYYLRQKQINAQKPSQMGCFVEFDTKSNPVLQVRTGISFVDMEGARNNLQKIITPFNWSFAC